MRRIPDAMAKEELGRHRADHVELVLDLEHLPVGQAEVANNQLLPLGLTRPRCVPEADGHRNRRREPFPACDMRGNREHRR